MTSQIREEVAIIAGRLIVGKTADVSVVNGQQEKYGLSGGGGELTLTQYAGDSGCGSKHGPDGSNFCLIDAKSGQHICLSVYGKVFDGYDYGSEALFGGFVANNTVSLYDYQEAYYFDYQL